MKISYRQGLLSSQTNFLQMGQDDSRFVDLIVSPTPTVATAAFKNVNYLISEQRSVTNAWGPFSGSQTQYLYWDINQFNGSITRGSTTLPPLVLGMPPDNPSINQMWFDTSENIMKVFDGNVWNIVIRVFAGTLQGGAILQAQPFASQVGLNTPANAGFIMQDGFGNAFRGSNGALLTSDTPLLSNDTGSLVKIQGSEIYALANENIPKFSAVYLISGRAALASGEPQYLETRAPMAVVTTDVSQNQTTTLATGGKSISNDQWNFSTNEIGKNVYCGANGELTLTKPVTLKYVRVGTVVGAKTILLTLDWVTELIVAENSISTISANAPLLKSGTNNVVLSLPQATSIMDGFISASDFARIPQLENDLTLKSDITHVHEISNINGLTTALSDKASAIHSHNISDVLNLQTALDDKASVVHSHNISDVLNLQTTLNSINNSISLKTDKVVGGTSGNLTSLDSTGNLVDSGSAASDFADVFHGHAIIEVSGLTQALDLKANADHTQDMTSIVGLLAALDDKAQVMHTHEISSINNLETVLGNKADTIHIHAVSEVDGLQAALDTKAEVVHIHSVSDVIGLQDALDLKANVTHSHIIGDVTGLQLALDSKALLSHQHAISDVVNLQDNLDLKANISHQHAISDVVNLQDNLDAKAPISHMHSLANNLSDVDVITVGPVAGDALVWDGTHWVPGAVSGGTGGGSKFLPGKMFRLQSTNTIPNELDGFVSYDYYASEENGLSPIYWQIVEDDVDAITIPAASEVDFRNTMWEITLVCSMWPIDASANPTNWLFDNPGAPVTMKHGASLSVINGERLSSSSDDMFKFITTPMGNQNIKWSEHIVVRTFNNDMKFTPGILAQILDGINPITVKFGASIEVHVKYMGDINQAMPES